MIITITSLRARGEDEIAVSFRLSEGNNICDETFVISGADILLMKLSAGDSTREVYEEVSRAADIHYAVKRALSVLGYGACSKKNLERKLVMKQIAPDIAAEACDILEKKGYIDDSSNAVREAELCARKLWGTRRIAAAMYKKGYSESAVREAIYGLEDEGVDFVSNCARLIESRYSSIPEDRAELGKLYAAMMRYGYSSSEISDALRLIEDGEQY